MRRATILTFILAGLPSLAWAAEAVEAHHEHATNWFFAGTLIIYFIVFVALMVWLLRKPLANFFASRSDDIAKRLAAADEARLAAEAKLREYEQKIDELMKTREEILESAKREAEGERERLLAAAGEQAERLTQDAERQVKQTIEEAERALSREAVQRLVAEAESVLSHAVTPDDLVRLADRYIDNLKEVRRA